MLNHPRERRQKVHTHSRTYIHMHVHAHTHICAYAHMYTQKYTMYITSNTGTFIRTEAHRIPTSPVAVEESLAANPVIGTSRNSLDSTISSVPVLPSPIRPLDEEHVPAIESEESLDPLSLEMEVQDLMDRVVTLESGQANILEVHKSVLQKQNKILSQLSAIENHVKAHTVPRSYRPFIPPPPTHAQPVLKD